MDIVFRVLCIVFIVVVALCFWKTVEYFNTLPEGNRWRGVLAWDLLILFYVLIALALKLIMI